LPRQKTHTSAADRQRAYRERQVELEQEAQIAPVARGPNVAHVSEDEYVRHAVAQARAYAEQTSPDATLTTMTIGERVAAAAAYAHWRYRAYLAGEVTSL
jgi:hypothetical protein